MLSNFLKKLMFARQFEMNEGKIEILGIRQNMFSTEFFVNLQENHAKEISKAIMDSTRNEMRIYAKQLDVDKKSIIKYVPELFNLFGLGKIEIVDADFAKKKAIIKVHESPLVQSYKKIKECVVTGSVLAGMMGFCFDKDLEYEEKNCMSKGDTSCQFILK
ncbi:4-vinyl reductase [Candidatus Woesearchaeota archaeon]|nr:4-vinyl reductase [Candidatus Woesearchaeota archaeon]